MLSKPCNVLLLDEPTNDLDRETLASLEVALEKFPGCAVVISHDRFFLDRLATHILAFEGDSHVEWFEGNFADYIEDKKRRLGPDADLPKKLKFVKFDRWFYNSCLKNWSSESIFNELKNHEKQKSENLMGIFVFHLRLF